MLHYETHLCGQDKDWVIFVHGLGGNSNIWYKQTEEYKKHFNIIFVDLFGHGGTEESLDAYTFETLAKGVVDVLDHAKIDTAHFVGISLGSIIIDAISLIAPERIKSIVLGGAALDYDFRAKFLLRSGAILKRLVPYMWLYRLFAFIMMPRKNHATSRNVFIREAKKLGGKEFRKWYKLMGTLLSFYQSYRLRSANTIPKLYISGDEDHLFLPFVIRNYLRERFSSIHIIEKCGHVCNIERHGEFNRISLYYLNSYPNLPMLKNVPEKSAARKIPQEHWALQ
ncbi:MAG: alpha/beta hydrolase [Desulfobacteraceae bacterium]|nr:MAG: alpha/beta hydrolase [Desulfobacteraceae bacterium]